MKFFLLSESRSQSEQKIQKKGPPPIHISVFKQRAHPVQFFPIGPAGGFQQLLTLADSVLYTQAQVRVEIF